MQQTTTEHTLTHISKLLLTDVSSEGMVFSIAQVGREALSLPYWSKVERTIQGKIKFSWRWMPGEPKEEAAFDRETPLGYAFEHLAQRIRGTKP